MNLSTQERHAVKEMCEKTSGDKMLGKTFTNNKYSETVMKEAVYESISCLI